MSDPEDDRDFLNEIKALEDVLANEDVTSEGKIFQADLPKCNIPSSSSRRSIVQSRGFGEIEPEREDIETIDIKDLHTSYETNLRLIEILRETRRELETILEKCRENKSAIEEKIRFRGSASRSSKVLICTAGMPYFKDAKHYPAPLNIDARTKLNNEELQTIQLRYTCGWTAKDRNILWRAIRHEGAAAILEGKRLEETRAQRSVVEVNSDEDHADNGTKDKEEADVNRRADGNAAESCASGARDTLNLPKNFRAMIGPLGAREFDWMKISAVDFEGRHTADECRVMWRVFLHPDVNRYKWTRDEDERIESLAEKYNCQDWDALARELNTQRSGYQCFIRYNSINRICSTRDTPWTSEDDDRLRATVNRLKIGHYIPWGLVGRYMTGRNKAQVYYRWTYNAAPHLKKGRFTSEEDKQLASAVRKFGTNFSKISTCVMPNRSSVQLSDHYNTLSLRKHGMQNCWTIKEDVNLLLLYNKYGAHWSKIADKIAGKTRTQARHRHKAIQRYWDRGISLYEIPREDKKKDAIPITSEDLGNKGLVESLERDRIKTAKHPYLKNLEPVDIELRKYFQLVTPTTKPGRKRKYYGDDELDDITLKSSAILKALSAEIVITDDLTNSSLTEKDKQLIRSIRDYQPGQGRMSDLLARPIHYGRIFGSETGATDGEKHFTAMCSGDCNMKIKSRWHDVIDYVSPPSNDHCQIKLKMTLNTPAMIVSLIGDEKNFEFEKIVRIYVPPVRIKSTSVNIHREIFVQEAKACPKKLSTIRVDNSTIGKTENREISLVNSGANQTCRSRRKAAAGKDLTWSFILSEGLIRRMDSSISCVEPNYHTLLGLQRIILREKNRSKEQSRDSITIESQEGHRAMELLKKRIFQLFKYPIGMSRILRPETDTEANVEDCDEVTTSNVEIIDDSTKVTSPPAKRKRLCKNNEKNATNTR